MINLHLTSLDKQKLTAKFQYSNEKVIILENDKENENIFVFTNPNKVNIADIVYFSSDVLKEILRTSKAYFIINTKTFEIIEISENLIDKFNEILLTKYYQIDDSFDNFSITFNNQKNEFNMNIEELILN